VRGVYAKKALPAGTALTAGDLYLAVPLLQGQISCRELMNGEVLLNAVEPDKPIMFTNIDSPYSANSELATAIARRGIDPRPPEGAPTVSIVRKG
jgi:hypothetical protein